MVSGGSKACETTDENRLKRLALATGLKETHAPFTHGAGVTERGERHRGRLLKMNV